MQIWDLATGTLKLSLTGHISTVRAVCVSARHPYLFSVGEDKTVKCWDLEQNRVVRDYHGHFSAVYTADVHPTLDVLATGSRDSTVRVRPLLTDLNSHCHCHYLYSSARLQYLSLYCALSGVGHPHEGVCALAHRPHEYGGLRARAVRRAAADQRVARHHNPPVGPRRRFAPSRAVPSRPEPSRRAALPPDPRLRDFSSEAEAFLDQMFHCHVSLRTVLCTFSYICARSPAQGRRA